MDGVRKNELISFYNTTGSLRYRPASEAPYLKSIGWKQVVNPKRDYAPELDQSTPTIKKITAEKR